MILINLAPASQQRSGKGGGTEIAFEGGASSDVQKQGAMKLLLVLVPVIALYFYGDMVVSEKRRDLRSKQEYLNSLNEKIEQAKGVVDEIKKFREDKARLEIQISTIESLTKERLREVKILDAIQTDIPQKTWLTKIEVQNDLLTLSGYSAVDADTTSFMEKLSNSIHLKDVNLIKSEENQVAGGYIKRFEISSGIFRENPMPKPGDKQ